MNISLKDIVPYYDAREYLWHGKVKTAIFDFDAVKSGEAELYDVYAVDADKQGLISVFSSIASETDFPYSSALKNAAKECGTVKTKAKAGVENDGIFGIVCEKTYFLGSKSYLKSKCISIPDAVRRTDFLGYTPLYAADENEFLGVFLFFDGILEIARQAVDVFDRLNIKTVLMGDAKKVNLAAKRLFVKEKRHAVLKIEKERVLQEFNKSDRIILINNGSDVGRYLRLVTVGKNMLKLKRFNAFCVGIGLLFTLAFAYLPLFWVLFWAMTTAMVLYNSLAMRRYALDLPTYREEEKMFFKAQYTMHIKGMSCAHCSARVKCALESIRGVSADVSLEEKVARIKCSASLDVNKLSAAVTEAGFTVDSVEKV